MTGDLSKRIASLEWDRILAELDARGFATTGSLLTMDECDNLQALYAAQDLYRSKIIMARHGFGQGEYQYFKYPLPPVIQEMREYFYPHLAGLANRWNKLMGLSQEFPQQLDDMLRRCHDAGQTRPTPLILKYQADDYNCLHQDLYGEHVFPLQAAVLLSAPGQDFGGGEFVLVEQRPRMQSKAEVVHLDKGEGVIFAVSMRPAKGSRGFYRVNLRHGVSRIRQGQRFTAGIIFHDAA
jgi:hypothetical protein